MNGGRHQVWQIRLEMFCFDRLAQYITMYPATDDEARREERIACWRNRHAPSHWERDIPEALRGREQQNPPATLSPLGRKLLGLDLW